MPDVLHRILPFSLDIDRKPFQRAKLDHVLPLGSPHHTARASKTYLLGSGRFALTDPKRLVLIISGVERRGGMGDLRHRSGVLRGRE